MLSGTLLFMSRPSVAELAFSRVAAQLRRPFVRQAGILQVGSFAALGASFIASVLLARLLGRESYGAYALVVSTMTTISLFKRLGQDYVATTNLAAAYARQDAVAGRRALVAFNTINVWSTIVVIPPALLLAPAIMERWFAASSLGDALRLALLPPIWAMLLATVVILLQCSRRLVLLTALENANSVGLAAAALLLVLAGMGVNGVFLGQVFASLLFALIAAGIYAWLRWRDALIPTWHQLLLGALRPGPAERREFFSGIAVALDKNLISLYALAPILLLGSHAPTDQVGLLRVAMSYLAVPLVALGAVSRLLMVKLPELQAAQPKRVERFFFQVTLAGGAISCLLTIPFVLLAPWLIGLLYGSDFAGSSQLVLLLALQPLLAGFGLAAGPIYRTYRRNLWAIYANLASLVVGLPLAYFLVQSYAMQGAALAYSLLATSVLAVSYVLCWRIVHAARLRAA